MKNNAVRYKAGQYVCHSMYGWGTVVDCNRDQTVVFFRTIGVKRLVTSEANFARVGGEVLKKKTAVV
jgi:hypothetical protein